MLMHMTNASAIVDKVCEIVKHFVLQTQLHFICIFISIS